MVSDTRRILVLGSSPHTRLVEAYKWDELPELLNVADYDVVILKIGEDHVSGAVELLALKILPDLQDLFLKAEVYSFQLLPDEDLSASQDSHPITLR